MRVLVVDDERVARRRLVRMLDEIDGVQVVGEAANGEDALERIRELAPDVLLLDVRMPGRSGIELALEVPDLPHVIFTTAHGEYAVQAFEASAVDYLLKPVRRERLARALDKVRRHTAPAEPETLRRTLREVLTGADVPRLAARRGASVHLFDPREVARFSASGGYTVFRQGEQEYLLDESVSALEARLAGLGFVRVHRRELVNAARVVLLSKRDDDTIARLDTGEEVVVSRRQVAVLRQKLGLG